MRIFSKLYTKVMQLAAHPHAVRYLAGLSFAESSFFPVPPDVMLAPMTLATPRRAWFLAALTTAASVLGGMAGYAIGLLAFDLIEPFLHRAGYWPAYLHAREWFRNWGFWAVLLAGFSPVPYKIFTIAAGVAAKGAAGHLWITFIVRHSAAAKPCDIVDESAVFDAWIGAGTVVHPAAAKMGVAARIGIAVSNGEAIQN